MDMVLLLITAAVLIVFYAASLWVGMKMMKVEGTFGQILAIATITSLLSVIPAIGPFIALVVLFILIGGWLHANFWPDAVAMVVIAGIVRFAVGLILAGLFEGA